MRSFSRQRLGTALILVAVVAVVGSFAVSAATAPDAAVGPTNDTADRDRTVVGMQAAGRVTMFAANGSALWSTGANNVDYFDVTRLENGSVLAGYIAEGQQACGEYEPPCSRTGFRVIDPNPEPHVTGEWSFPVRVKLNSEVHDVNPLPNGEFLLTDMAHERVFTVAPNGTVTWQWNASQRYDAPANPTGQDWLHINDVDRIGDGRYMVSVREPNQLLIIERGTGVVGVINKDQPGSNGENCQREGDLADYNNDSGGAVHCGDPTLFKQQHNPQYLGPDAVLVADSENDRVVELHNQSGNWTIAWRVDSARGVRFDWPRDADRLPNGNTLITDSRNNRVVEVTPDGTTVWSTKTGIWPYDAERLPSQERLNSSDLPRMNATGDAPTGDDTPTGGDETDLPLLGQAYAGLSYVVQLPLWFEPWHIGLAAVGVVLVVVGGGLVWSGRRNR